MPLPVGTERLVKRFTPNKSSPIADPAMVTQETATMVVQINGKVRDRLEVDADIDDAEMERLALASARVQEQLQGRQPAKVVTRPPKLVNLVVSS